MSDIITDEFGNALGLEMHTDEQMQTAIAEMGSDMVCSAPSAIPVDLPCDFFTQENQGCWPFCHGFMRAGCEEVLAWIATKGKSMRFSRRFSAVTDMRMDGNDSSPAGASIPGAMRGSAKYGNAYESMLPYFPLPPAGYQGNSSSWCRQHYSNELSDTILTSALQHKIQKVVPGIKSYDQMDAGLTSGNFCMAFGTTWTTGWASLRGKSQCDKVPGGQVLGGHALFAFGWKTIAQERWYYLHNSHLGWGVQMKCLISPAQWDRILQGSQYGALLVSDMALTDQPRGWDWLEEANSGLMPSNIQFV